MDWWSTKCGEAKVPVIPDGRPCLNDGLMGMVLPVAERYSSAENTHRASGSPMKMLGSVECESADSRWIGGIFGPLDKESIAFGGSQKTFLWKLS